MTLFSSSKLPFHGMLGRQSSQGAPAPQFPFLLGSTAIPKPPQDGTCREQHRTELRTSRKRPRLCRRRHCQASPSLLLAPSPLWFPDRASSHQEWAELWHRLFHGAEVFHSPFRLTVLSFAEMLQDMANSFKFICQVPLICQLRGVWVPVALPGSALGC